jgi:hypothetical protein
VPDQGVRVRLPLWARYDVDGGRTPKIARWLFVELARR